MNRFVLDSSVTMAWYLDDEADHFADALLGDLPGTEAVVPYIWPLEVANVLLVAERRRRLTEADSTRILELLSSLPIMVDDASPAQALRDILSLGRQHSLSSYDAAYLELAMRQGIPLATLDERLREAARSSGVSLVST